MGVTGGWFRNVLAFAVVLALSLAVAWLFDNYDLVSGTFFGASISYLYFPGAMFSAFFICGVHDDTVPKFLCYFAGVCLETLVIWLILRAIWRAVKRDPYA